jgi:hypothetical protein
VIFDGLLKLPEDILGQIFSYLNMRDLVSLSKGNKQLFKMIQPEKGRLGTKINSSIYQKL